MPLIPKALRPARAGLLRVGFHVLEAAAARLGAWARSRRNPAQPDRARDDERGEEVSAWPR